LQEGRENANIDAALGFIWGISVQTMRGKILIKNIVENIALPFYSRSSLGTETQGRWNLNN
jgi:hypothetical protein